MKNGERMRKKLIDSIEKMDYENLSIFLTEISGIESIRDNILKETHERFEEEMMEGQSIEKLLKNGEYMRLLSVWYEKEET